MTIRHLQVFSAVCDCGSMTGAAEKLHIAQPSVSLAIAELEEYYGVRLFERIAKRLYITEDGKQMLSYARHAVSLFDEMEKAVSKNKTQTVKIGASVTVGTCILIQLVKKFQQIYPKTKINAFVDNTTVIEELIMTNEVDFGLVEGKVHNQSILSKPFMDDELVLICGRGSIFWNKSCVEPAELSGLEFIVREQGSGTRELFFHVMAANGIEWKVGWVCNNAETIKNAVMENMGISVISRMAVEKEIQDGFLRIVRINGMDFKRKYRIIYHKNKFISPVIELFWKNCLDNKRD